MDIKNQTISFLEAFILNIMYQFSCFLIPNKKPKNFLINFPGLYTTILILSSFLNLYSFLEFNLLFILFSISFHLHSQKIPKSNKIIPIPNNQPVVGSNKTSNIPTPNPIRQTPKVFFNIFIFKPPHKLSLVYNMKKN